MLPVAMVRSPSDGNAIRYVYVPSFGFVNDITFSYDGLCTCFVRFAKWLHWEQSLLSSTASC